ncbi:hypothetical protein [Streptomyces sp. NPDC048637]
MTRKQRTATVVGGGIGGLATALSSKCAALCPSWRPHIRGGVR